MTKNEPKPVLTLVKGGEGLTVEKIATMFKKLTGRVATPEEMKQVQVTLARAEVLPNESRGTVKWNE